MKPTTPSGRPSDWEGLERMAAARLKKPKSVVLSLTARVRASLPEALKGLSSESGPMRSA